MPSPTSLYLASPQAGSFAVTLHPVVVLSVLDHYLRRAEGQESVAGTLLGWMSDDESEVHVTNAFPVQYSPAEVRIGHCSPWLAVFRPSPGRRRLCRSGRGLVRPEFLRGDGKPAWLAVATDSIHSQSAPPETGTAKTLTTAKAGAER
jgi:hypothetical protein